MISCFVRLLESKGDVLTQQGLDYPGDMVLSLQFNLYYTHLLRYLFLDLRGVVNFPQHREKIFHKIRFYRRPIDICLL